MVNHIYKDEINKVIYPVRMG